jgi:hypothetical protein
MGLIESLYKTDLDTRKLGKVKDDIKNLPSNIKKFLNINHPLTHNVLLQSYNLLRGMLFNDHLFIKGYKPTTISISPDISDKVTTIVLDYEYYPSLFNISLPFYATYIGTTLFENYLAKNTDLDIRGTLSSVSLSLLNSLCGIYVAYDIFNIAKAKAWEVGLTYLYSDVTGYAAAFLALTPFIYFSHKYFSSRETQARFENLFSKFETGGKEIYSALKFIYDDLKPKKNVSQS